MAAGEGIAVSGIIILFGVAQMVSIQKSRLDIQELA